MLKNIVRFLFVLLIIFAITSQLSYQKVSADGEWVPDNVIFDELGTRGMEEINDMLKGKTKSGETYVMSETRWLDVTVCMYCGKELSSKKTTIIFLEVDRYAKMRMEAHPRNEEGWDKRTVDYVVCDECEGKEFEVNEYVKYICSQCDKKITKLLIGKTKKIAKKGDWYKDVTWVKAAICDVCAASAAGEDGIGVTGGGGKPPDGDGENGDETEEDSKVSVTKTTIYKCKKCGYEYDKKVETLEVTKEEAVNYPKTVIDENGLCANCAE